MKTRLHRWLFLGCLAFGLALFSAIAYAVVIVSGQGPVAPGTTLAAVYSYPVGAAIGGQGGFAFNSSGGTRGYWLGSAGTATTSVACSTVTINLAGTGTITNVSGTASVNVGQPGLYFATAGTNTFIAAPLTLSATNLNTLVVTGTGQCGFLYNK